MTQSNIDWAEMYFQAEASNEPFEDVKIVTARSQLAYSLYQEAATLMRQLKISVQHEDVVATAKRLHKSYNLKIQESVTIDSKGITVVIDAPHTGGEYTWRALDYVSSALDQMGDRIGGVFTFGAPVTYDISQLEYDLI